MIYTLVIDETDLAGHTRPLLTTHDPEIIGTVIKMIAKRLKIESLKSCLWCEELFLNENDADFCSERCLNAYYDSTIVP